MARLKTIARTISLGLQVLLIAAVPVFLWAPAASALQMTQKSVDITSSAASAVVSHTFQFMPVQSSNIGSIRFSYCSNSPLFEDPCLAPVGLDVNSAVLTGQGGNTGFSIDAGPTNASTIVLTRASSPGSSVLSTYSFSTITNPSAPSATTYVRIETFATIDATGSETDRGATAFSTTRTLQVGAFVPPFLRMCVGLVVAADCSSFSGFNIDLGDLSSKVAKFGTSQFAAGTNDPTGYIVYSLGHTMTSGNNIIPGLATPTTSKPGQSQFGINLRSNGNPPVGTDKTGAGTAVPTANYNTPNLYTFVPGASIATSSNSTDFNRMTVSYIVNISDAQPAGVYSTTVTYMASVSF